MDNLDYLSNSLSNYYLYILLFFTTWNVLFVILHKYTHTKINLLYLSFITLIGGLYISFINPRKFVYRVGDEKYIFDGISKFLVIDVPFHIAIFLWIYCMYYSYYKNGGEEKENLFISFLIFVLYVSIVNIKRVYGISFIEFLLVFAVAHLVYFAIF